MNELLIKTDELQKQINELRPLSRETVLSLKDYYKIGLTWSSNAIEGNTLTVYSTESLMIQTPMFTVKARSLYRARSIRCPGLIKFRR